jgi:hypothetical protein
MIRLMRIPVEADQRFHKSKPITRPATLAPTISPGSFRSSKLSFSELTHCRV